MDIIRLEAYKILNGDEKRFFDFLVKSLDWIKVLNDKRTDKEAKKQIEFTVTCLLKQKTIVKCNNIFGVL